MLRKLIQTNNQAVPAILRLVLGVVFFAHGAQKMLGWWGGYGFSGTMGMFTHQMGVPAVFAFLAIAAEFFGGLGLIVGLLGRVAAFGIACNMVVAIVKVHAPNGLFMNWTGHQKGEGFEYHLLVLAMTGVIMIVGSGALSIDLALSRR
jgi:putative oxidoreductase